MSSSATGLGGWKKGGRVSDASAVTQNIRVVAQGQADATYASTQKKNPYRQSQAVLNGEAYNGQTMSRTDLQNLDRFAPLSFNAFADFSSLFRINGDASTTVVSNTVTLVPASAGKKGTAFCTIPIRPNASFVIHARVRLPPHVDPADGFSIGLVSDPTWLGEGGGEIGLTKNGGPSPPGIVIKFTTFDDAIPSSGVYDTAGNLRGSNTEFDSNVIDGLVSSGYPFNVTINYNKVSSTMSWVLAQDGGCNYTQSFGPIAGINVSQFLGGSNAYLGIGAGTGLYYQRVDFTALTYSNSP